MIIPRARINISVGENFTIECNKKCMRENKYSAGEIGDCAMKLLFYYRYPYGRAIKLKLQRSNVSKRFRHFVVRGCLPGARVYPLVLLDAHRSTCIYTFRWLHAYADLATLCICCMCSASNCVAFSCYAEANVISLDLTK